MQESRMHYPEPLSDGNIGLGRQILPNFESYEEWIEAGKQAVAESYDVHAIGLYYDLPDEEPTAEWVVTAEGEEKPENQRFRLDIEGKGDYTDPETYTTLRDQIEERLGKTGLTIIIS